MPSHLSHTTNQLRDCKHTYANGGSGFTSHPKPFSYKNLGFPNLESKQILTPPPLRVRYVTFHHRWEFILQIYVKNLNGIGYFFENTKVLPKDYFQNTSPLQQRNPDSKLFPPLRFSTMRMYGMKVLQLLQ